MRVTEIQAAFGSIMAKPSLALVFILVIGVAVGAIVALGSIHARIIDTSVLGTDVDTHGVTIGFRDKGNTLRPIPIAFVEYLNANSLTLSAVASRSVARMDVAIGDHRQHLRIESVHGPYFQTLGVTPTQGRLFQSEDFAYGAPGRAVLSHAMWEREFGSSENAIGATIQINGAPFQIVGVASSVFRGLDAQKPTQLWVPVFALVSARIRAPEQVLQQMETNAIGRLVVPGTKDTVAQELERLRAGYQGEMPYLESDADLVALSGIVDNLNQLESLQRLSSLWLSVSVLVYIVAALNVAILYLSRLVERRGEFFIRRSVGATSLALARQLAWEASLLTGAGVALGVVFSIWIRRLVLQLGEFSRAPSIGTLDFGGSDLAHAAAAWAFGAMLIFVSAGGYLRESRDSRIAVTHFSRKHLLLRFFGSAQLAVAILAIATAGIAGQRLVEVLQAEIGMDIHQLYSAQPTFAANSDDGVTFNADLAMAVSDQLQLELDRFPGTAVVQVSQLPFGAAPDWRQIATVPHAQSTISTVILHVQRDFFLVTGITLLAGEPPDDSAPTDVVINLALAQRLFGSVSSAMGRTIFLHEYDGRKLTLSEFVVKGVSSNASLSGMGSEHDSVLYRPFTYIPFAPILIRLGNAPTERVLEIVDSVVREYYPGLEIRAVIPLMDRLEKSRVPQKARALVSIAGALVIVVLAATGVLATIANILVARRSELALRQALGATRRRIILQVGRSTLSIAGVAVAMSIPVGLFVMPAVSGWATGSWTTLHYLWLLPAAFIVVIVAIVSAIGPAKNAVDSQPADLLRVE